MFTAGELTEILQARYRRRFPLHADRPFGGFPPTWRAWFLSMQERVGAVIGAPVVDYLAVFRARALRPPPKASAELSRWRAFVCLVRQQWEPAPRDQRWMRGVAAVFTGLLHILFMVLLLWLGFVAIGDAPPDARQAGETVLIEYIGTGTPAEQGGAAAPGETEAPASSAAPAPAQAAAASAAAAPPVSASATPDVPASEQPPQPAEAASAQPLVVTETVRTDIDFTLPAPVPRDIALPQLQVAVPQVASEIVEIQTFEPRAAVREVERPVLRVPTPNVPTLRTDVAEVEVQRPPTEIQARTLPQTAVRTPEVRVPALRTTPGEVQLRAPPAPATTGTAATQSPAAKPAAPAPAPGNAAAAAGRATTPVPAAASGGRPQAQGTGRSNAPTGTGPAPSPRPGAAPSATRGDDWGDSNRNVPGNSTTAGRSPGLFNSDGTVRLPGDGGRVGGGLPPGTIIEDFEKIDRMGTWLKRPPLDYTPTRFDRFWVPNRTLLEEWVSRGIKKVAIPIPGTSKRIECTVSLLSAGGGCTIYDPNLQDQEAVARPPPDVPFKPELQEDKDSLKK